MSTCSTILLLFSGIIDTSISFYTLSLATMHCFVFDDALLFFFDLFGVEYGILLHIYLLTLNLKTQVVVVLVVETDSM